MVGRKLLAVNVITGVLRILSKKHLRYKEQTKKKKKKKKKKTEVLEGTGNSGKVLKKKNAWTEK